MGSNSRDRDLRAARDRAREMAEQGRSDYDMYKQQYEDYRTQAADAWSRDFGGSASEFMDKTHAASTQQANKQAQEMGSVAAQQAAAASRMQGGSRGLAQQSGLQAGAQAATGSYLDAYRDSAGRYASAVQMDQDRLQSNKRDAAAQQASAGSLWSQGDANAINAISGRQTAAERASPWIQGAGMLGSLIFTSDAKAKEDIKPVDSLVLRLEKIRGGV